MGSSVSRRMEDSDSRSRPEDGADSDLAAILQYLIRRCFFIIIIIIITKILSCSGFGFQIWDDINDDEIKDKFWSITLCYVVVNVGVL